MAKFRLKASLIPKLTERNVISPDTGKIKMRIPWKQNRISGEKCFEIEFLPTDVIETDNDFSTSAFRAQHSPALKVGTEWFISDPTVPWFDELVDATVPTAALEIDGTEVMVRKHRLLLCEYAKDKNLALGAPVTPSAANKALLNLAAQHHQEKLSSR